MAGKEFREVRKRLGNEPADSSPYVGYARALLGELKHDMKFAGLQQGARRRRIGDVLIEAISMFGQDEIRISPVKTLERKRRGMKELIKYRYNVILGSFYRQGDASRMRTFIKVGGNPAKEVAPIPFDNPYVRVQPGGLSSDGMVAAITVRQSNLKPPSAARWTENSYEETGTFAADRQSTAMGISADGEKVFGYDYGGTGSVEWMDGFIWTRSTGMIKLPPLAGHTQSEAHGMSADGRIIVGRSGDDVNYDMQPCYWDVSDLRNIPSPVSLGAFDGIAYATNEDGTVIVGKSGCGLELCWGVGFIWTKKDGVVELEVPSGYDVAELRAVSANGRIVAGNAINAGDATIRTVVQWKESTGIVAKPGGTYSGMFGSQGMNHDGTVIVGSDNANGITRACIWTGDSFAYIEDDMFNDSSDANCVTTVEGEREVVLEPDE